MPDVPSTFEGACALLENHRKGGDTVEQTLNRLFGENLRRRQGWRGLVPELKAANTLILAETKSKQEFARLQLNPRAHAHDSEGPILIVRYAGMDCLIDGHHRCLAWRESRDTGEHTACVVVVCDNGE